MNDNKFSIKKHFFSSLFDQNPILVQLLGTCPTLASSKTLADGIGMGLTATAVLILSNLLISLLRKFIPKQVRIAAFIVIISGFVTAVELLIKAFIPSLDESLGIFIPLIVVNCIILARAEAFASKNGPIPSMLDGLFMGIGFTFALAILGSMREFFGTGSLLGFTIIPGYPENAVITGNAGAFLALGILIAAVNWILTLTKEKKGGNK